MNTRNASRGKNSRGSRLPELGAKDARDPWREARAWQGVWDGVHGQSPGRGSGERSPPEA